MKTIFGMSRLKFSVTFFILFTISVMLLAQEKEIILDIGKGNLRGSLLPAIGQGKEYPLVVFISGSGPTDRNGNQAMVGSNTIALLADSLAALGISSFRYDKRGVGKSQLYELKEELLLIDTFVADLLAWIDYFGMDAQNEGIILAGHSEGALMATLAAQQRSSVRGLITLAGAGRPADSLMLQQFQRQPAFVSVAADSLFRQLREGLPLQPPPFLLSLFRPGILPYVRSWIMIDPAFEISKLDIPVLVISGDADLQVFAEDADRLSGAARRGELLVFQQMNHILKAVTSPADNMASYMDAQRPIYPGLAAAIQHWIETKFSQE